MELFHANQQWATRPEDERFTSLQQLFEVTRTYAKEAYEKEGVRIDTLDVEAIGPEVMLVGKGGRPAMLTHWAFGQLAARVGAPASYLRELPAPLAATNLRHGLERLKERAKDATANLLLHTNGSLVIRAMTSDKYERIWNWEIAERLLGMAEQGWEPATPDIRRKSDDPTDSHNFALYASDHDMFAFIRHRDRVIKEEGNPDGLQRGLIVSNSEVGARKLRYIRFLYREMCGNHIIWGAEDVVELSLRHIGDIRGKVKAWEAEVQKYLDSTAEADEAMVRAAKRKLIAATKEEVLDTLFGKKIPGLTRKVLEMAYEATIPEEDGDPRSVWGVVQGITRHSQTIRYADERTALDTAAGRLLKEAF